MIDVADAADRLGGSTRNFLAAALLVVSQASHQIAPALRFPIHALLDVIVVVDGEADQLFDIDRAADENQVDGLEPLVGSIRCADVRVVVAGAPLDDHREAAEPVEHGIRADVFVGDELAPIDGLHPGICPAKHALPEWAAAAAVPAVSDQRFASFLGHGRPADEDVSDPRQHHANVTPRSGNRGAERAHAGQIEQVHG